MGIPTGFEDDIPVPCGPQGFAGGTNILYRDSWGDWSLKTDIWAGGIRSTDRLWIVDTSVHDSICAGIYSSGTAHIERTAIYSNVSEPTGGAMQVLGDLDLVAPGAEVVADLGAQRVDVVEANVLHESSVMAVNVGTLAV